jgi:hypothetical protein
MGRSLSVRWLVYDVTACEKFIGHGEIILQTK